MATETLTWFGGLEGVIAWRAMELHLRKPGGHTLCGLTGGVRPVTRREANSPRMKFCEDCYRKAQGDAA